MIVCLCRGKTDRDVMKAIEGGAETLRDLQRCGIGTDCGSCHESLRSMLATAAAASVPCPYCAAEEPVLEVTA